MSSITQVSDTMQTILNSRAKALERESGFVERASAQLDGPVFAQTMVLTWMHTAEASYTQLRHTAASLGVHVSNQASEQRISLASARLMRALLEEAVGEVIGSEASAPQVLARFNGVYLQDGTVISLPASLAQEWPGRGSMGQEAALRVQGQLELGSGSLSGVWLQEMRQRGERKQYWLTQCKATLTIIDQAGQWWDLLSFLRAQRSDEVDVQVYHASTHRLPSARAWQA